MVTAGKDVSQNDLSSTEKFNMGTDSKWSFVGDLPVAVFLSSGVSVNNQILVSGK